MLIQFQINSKISFCHTNYKYSVSKISFYSLSKLRYFKVQKDSIGSQRSIIYKISYNNLWYILCKAIEQSNWNHIYLEYGKRNFVFGLFRISKFVRFRCSVDKSFHWYAAWLLCKQLVWAWLAQMVTYSYWKSKNASSRSVVLFEVC